MMFFSLIPKRHGRKGNKRAQLLTAVLSALFVIGLALLEADMDRLLAKGPMIFIVLGLVLAVAVFVLVKTLGSDDSDGADDSEAVTGEDECCCEGRVLSILAPVLVLTMILGAGAFTLVTGEIPVNLPMHKWLIGLGAVAAIVIVKLIFVLRDTDDRRDG
jgi:Co/Zn/Cd efflux system component